MTESELISAPTIARSESHRRLPGLRLALLSGIALWISAPPIGFWPLAWVALVPLVISVMRARHIGQAAWRGYLFGWAYLGPLWYWVGLTLTGWTGKSLGWLGWFGLTMILSWFYALWAGASWWLARRCSEKWRAIAIAAAWVVMEWLRTLGPLSMPWGQLSYTQYTFLPILQFSVVTGAYGISFLLILCSISLGLWRMNPANQASSRRVWASCVLAILLILYGIVRLQQPEQGGTIQAATMQSGISSFNVPDVYVQYQEMQRMTAQAAAFNPPPSLYVWPESAAPQDPTRHYEALRFFQNLASRYHAAILTGSRVVNSTTGDEYNSALLFLPGDIPPARYDKEQLVPFGEFIPFRSILEPVLGRSFDFPQSDVTPGAHAPPLQGMLPGAGHIAIGNFICYESMYPQLSRRFVLNGANLLATESNDSWFLSRAARRQHLSAVTLRAVENGRDLVRSTTTGISCLLDAEGRMLARVPPNRAGFVEGALHLHSGLTIYTRFGDWFVLLCMILLVLLPIQAKRQAGKRN